jgi:hypothetical protein
MPEPFVGLCVSLSMRNRYDTSDADLLAEARHPLRESGSETAIACLLQVCDTIMEACQDLQTSAGTARVAKVVAGGSRAQRAHATNALSSISCHSACVCSLAFVRICKILRISTR